MCLNVWFPSRPAIRVLQGDNLVQAALIVLPVGDLEHNALCLVPLGLKDRGFSLPARAKGYEHTASMKISATLMVVVVLVVNRTRT